jgi:hypothetical protein
MATSAPAFKPGDRVAWQHEFASQHGAGSIVRAEAVPQLPDDHPDKGKPGTGQFGTIVAQANDAGTWWEVQLDPAKGKAKKKADTRVLTSDELVRVEEPAA